MQLPQVLLQSLQYINGFNEKEFIATHEKKEPVTSIRINPAKKNELPSTLKKIPWSSNGYYLNKRPIFTTDPLLHAGAYYVQEASSMFLEQVILQTVDITKTLKVLDLCAAPGGKSTLIQSFLNSNSFLVSNEIIKSRVHILEENITKWGAANVVVTNNDPKDFKSLPNYFDVIVVDAPCSGSGLFRKDENAIKEWSEENVELCSQRQQRILADVFSSLKKDGILIYSTCSYSKKENEDILDWIVENFSVSSLELNTSDDWGIIETQSDKHKNFGYRFYPNKLKGEGFFIAAFKKTTEEKLHLSSTKQKNLFANKKEIELLQKHVQPLLMQYIKINNEFVAITDIIAQELGVLQNLYIKKAGVKIGELINQSLIPNHALALSTLPHNFTKIDVDKEKALQFLRKQDFKLDLGMQGWILLTYKNLGLGWAKILPNRINNYYPKEWRILHL